MAQLLCYDSTGSSSTRVGEVLERPSGMTLSREDLVLSVQVRSARRRKAIPLVASRGSLKGLILKQEGRG